MKDGFPVSIAELIAAGARPLPGEAVAILLDVCDQVVRQPAGGSVRPAVTPSALFVDGTGTVALSGGIPVEDDQTVQLLGRLLLQMLPAPGTAAALRVPSRLRDLASRAAAGELRRLSVARLASSLRRFAPEQPRATVQAMFERWRNGDHGGRGRASVPPLAVPRASASVPVEAVPTPVSRSALRRRVVGAMAAALLILAGVGAAYWLSADSTLPPVPLSPSLLSEPPAPPRGEWELLDPAGLAVDARPTAPGTQGAEAEAEKAKAKARSPGQGDDSGSLHRPDQ